MSKVNDGGSAYPYQHGSGHTYRSNKGMSLRDKFAGQALNGMLSHATRYRPEENDPRHWHDVISQEAYIIADAMLRAREK